MRSNYTCHRCLTAISQATRPKPNPALRPPLTYGRRGHASSSSGRALGPQHGPSQPQSKIINPFSKRSAHAAAAKEPEQVEKTVPLESAYYRNHNYPPAMPYPETYGRTTMEQDNLFHSLSRSPASDMRQRAAYIKQHAYCPHPTHQQTRLPVSPDDPESRKVATGAPLPPMHVNFECPDCGTPVYCTEDHWMDDYESHLEICDLLRQINEDDHDLRSGRYFPEFEYPARQFMEFLPNMTNWDTFLYTRQFEAINNERSMRQATRLLTYPLTIGSVLHELSPYSIRKGGHLTVEGLKSLTALRYTMHPLKDGAGKEVRNIRLRPPPVRIFILGARAESSLPREVWAQLSYLFHYTTINLIFIGPESMTNRDAEFPLPERTPANPFGAIVEDRISQEMKITTYVEYFHTLHEAQQFYPYDPYFDCFMLFHPGLGHPASAHEWEATLPQLLSTKCPILCTGYTEWDMLRDWRWVMEKCAGEVDLLMEPGENKFRSLRWDLNDLDPQDVSCGNWGIWGFRGKRYEATRRDSTE